jgi:probable F420-dependent oxidoreductase
MTVRFSCRCPNADYLGFEASPEAIIASAKKAEALGFDAVFVNDHIIVDGSARSAPWTNTYDPLVALSFIAANTTRIGLGVSVLIMPYRNPIASAKSLATIDRMSGGRLIAGIGVGWNEAEFNALGVPFHQRGARTTEYLRIWQACWAPGPVSFAGKFFAFSDMHVSPKPLQQPSPPIWIGGASDAALRRAATFAEVWHAGCRPRRPPGSFAQGLRPDRPSASPGNADELSGRIRPQRRECPALGDRAADRARHADRGCGGSASLSRSRGFERLPDQLPWLPQSRPPSRLDGLLHAGSQTAGNVS